MATVKSRILATVGALTLVFGSGVGIEVASSQAAFAVGPPAQYCATLTTGCMNAWNEGPAVNAYHSNVVNNNFSAYANPDGHETIEYLGPGPHNRQCISDFNNDPTDARAGLNGYCETGVDIAWGANFTLERCDNNTWAFKNIHWNGGYLTPNSNGNGAPFYLNSRTRTCYHVLGAG